MDLKDAFDQFQISSGQKWLTALDPIKACSISVYLYLKNNSSTF